MAQRRREVQVVEREQTVDERAATRHLDDVFPHLLDAAVGRHPEQDQIAVAVVDAISSEGVATVTVRGETHSCEASSVLQFPSAAAASEALLGRTVLVLRNPQTGPVIVGVVTQRLWQKRDSDASAQAQVQLPAGSPVTVQADKRRLDLEATDEIRLTCGKSSLVMRRDGTVVVRGVQIVSRASQSNKIRGATVSIN
jgi:hypothetical protein